MYYMESIMNYMENLEGFFLTRWKLFLVILFVVIFIAFSFFSVDIFGFLFATWFIWIPAVLGSFAWKKYMEYKQADFIFNKFKYVNLEINIPRDVHKSPQAIELVIDILNHMGGGAMAWQNRVWDGSVLFPSSLEIISVEGSIYFIIRAHIQVADAVKSALYSQYPNAEIHEVDDYTKYVPDFTKNEDTWDLYGADFKLANEDFIPIKTYVDYGLDKAVGSLEEEQKIDPITPLLEYLGTLRKGEQIWMQYIVRSDVSSDWRKRAVAYIHDLMGRNPAIIDDQPFQTVKLTYGEQEQIKAIERSLGKYAFETVIRAVYLAPKEHFNNSRVGFFKNPVFKAFNSMYLNDIRRNTDTTAVDWVWQDITGLRTPALKRAFFKDYVNRNCFYGNDIEDLNYFWKSKVSNPILTSEELATLFHIPGRVSETSKLERIDAVKAEAPQNLPI